jgi:hypothetical protein
VPNRETRELTNRREIVPLRHEPDAALHFEGDGEAAWGTKFVMVAARGTAEGTRVILDIERVGKPGAEASVAMNCFRRLAPLVPASDPDFARLYARRNDAESINRNLEDTLFLGRAHSLGRLRQHVDLIGYALLVNGLTILRHERRGRLPSAA